MVDDIVELSTENDCLKNIVGSYNERCLGEPKANLSKQFIDEKRANLMVSRMAKKWKTINKQIMTFVAHEKL